MRQFDLTYGQRSNREPPKQEQPALLQTPPKQPSKWNLFYHLWTGMQHAAYWVAPASGCTYCWLWRMFFIGMFVGMELMWFFPRLKIW